jgi:hypothetical protein
MTPQSRTMQIATLSAVSAIVAKLGGIAAIKTKNMEETT